MCRRCRRWGIGRRGCGYLDIKMREALELVGWMRQNRIDGAGALTKEETRYHKHSTRSVLGIGKENLGIPSDTEHASTITATTTKDKNAANANPLLPQNKNSKNHKLTNKPRHNPPPSPLPAPENLHIIPPLLPPQLLD